MKRLMVVVVVVVVVGLGLGLGLGLDAAAQPAPEPPTQPQPQLPTPQPQHSGSGSGTGSGAGSGSGPVVLQLPAGMGMPEVRAVASPTIVKLGTPFTLFVTASYGDGVEVNLRDKFELGSAFEIQPNKHTVEDRVENGRHVREWQFQIIPWEVGDLRVPPVPVTFTYAGKAAQIGTNPAPVKIIGLLGDTDDANALRGAAPGEQLYVRDWFWLWIGGGALLLLVVAYIVWRSYRRTTPSVQITGGVMIARGKVDSPASRALAKLDAIARSGILDRDDERKDGYQQMADVIREYIGARYRVATLDLTTAELSRALRPVAPLSEQEMIKSWLDRCDIVKYGGLKTSGDAALDVLAAARELVVATQPASAYTSQTGMASRPPAAPSPPPPEIM